MIQRTISWPGDSIPFVQNVPTFQVSKMVLLWTFLSGASEGFFKDHNPPAPPPPLSSLLHAGGKEGGPGGTKGPFWFCFCCSSRTPQIVLIDTTEAYLALGIRDLWVRPWRVASDGDADLSGHRGSHHRWGAWLCSTAHSNSLLLSPYH